MTHVSKSMAIEEMHMIQAGSSWFNKAHTVVIQS